jgi:hypothetical protein
MAKQPARLADFAIPRGDGLPADVQVAAAVEPHTAEPADPGIVPMRIAPRPIAEARQAMTVRLPVSMHERLRVLMFASRRSQQQIVEDALDAFLKANRTIGG